MYRIRSNCDNADTARGNIQYGHLQATNSRLPSVPFARCSKQTQTLQLMLTPTYVDGSHYSTRAYANHSQCQPECRKHMFSAILHCSKKDEPLAREIQRDLESLQTKLKVRIPLLSDLNPAKSPTFVLDKLVAEDTTTMFLILRTENYANDQLANEITNRIKAYVGKFDVVQIFSGINVNRRCSDSRLAEVIFNGNSQEFLEQMERILLDVSFKEGEEGKTWRRRCEANRKGNQSFQQESRQDWANGLQWNSSEQQRKPQKLYLSLQRTSTVPVIRLRNHVQGERVLETSMFFCDEDTTLKTDIDSTPLIFTETREKRPFDSGPGTITAVQYHVKTETGFIPISPENIQPLTSDSSSDVRTDKRVNKFGDDSVQPTSTENVGLKAMSLKSSIDHTVITPAKKVSSLDLDSWLEMYSSSRSVCDRDSQNTRSDFNNKQAADCQKKSLAKNGNSLPDRSRQVEQHFRSSKKSVGCLKLTPIPDSTSRETCPKTVLTELSLRTETNSPSPSLDSSGGTHFRSEDVGGKSQKADRSASNVISLDNPSTMFNTEDDSQLLVAQLTMMKKDGS